MKLRMLKEIARNFKLLLSRETWKEIGKDEGGYGGTLIILLFFTGCADILRMIFRPGYPNKTDE